MEEKNEATPEVAPAEGFGGETMEDSEQGAPLLCFSVAGLELGLEVEKVVEILDHRKIAPIPLAPVHVAGLFNLRGRAIPLLDLVQFFHLRQDAAGAESEFFRLVVVSAAQMRVGLLAHRVSGVRRIPFSAMRSPEVIQGQRLLDVLKSEAQVEGTLLAILDLEKLLLAARVR